MRLSRIIMALTVGLAVAAVPTAAGAAQPQPPVYPPNSASLTVSPTTIRLGETFTLRGSGFAPNESVRIDVAISGLPQAAPAEGPRGAATAARWRWRRSPTRPTGPSRSPRRPRSP